MAPGPRVLYIAFYFPPTRASGVYRSLATANFLADAGWDVTVATPQREFFVDLISSYDPTLEDRVHPSVRVERVRFPGRRWERDVRRFSWWRGNFPTLANGLASWAELRFFPEIYSPWVPRVVRRAVALHRREPFDLVLATGNPHAAFAAAWALGTLLRVPYVVDYRDSWTLDVFGEGLSVPEDDPAVRWERRILRSAGRAVFVNEALRAWHAGRYPEAADRMRVVSNGYEPHDLATVSGRRPEPDRPLRLGYLGTVTPKVPLVDLFAGWRLAREDPRLRDATVTVYGHLGFFPSSAEPLRAVLPTGEGIGVHYEGPVPKQRVGQVYDDLDVLLLVLAGTRYVTSGKVFEYMATGKPVVSVHDPASGAGQVLAGYPLWFPVQDLRPESVREALLAAADAARHADPATVERARAHARQFTRAAQLAPFEQELRELARG